ncbi:MAG: T9SS type A sorting domain-containing protein [Bacteroidia bacterium]
MKLFVLLNPFRSLVLGILTLCLGYGAPTKAATGGPDAYGYTWKDSNEPGGPTYQWIDITTTGTQVTGLGDDNFTGPYGFIDGFQFYWYYPTQVWIGSNGYLSFSGNNFASPFPIIPNTASPHNFIAGLMSDLNFDGPGNPGTCYYRNTADTIVISWINVPFWTVGTPSFSGSNSFQIVLVRSDRSITFNYQSQLGSTQNDDITIGIENITGQLGLQHSKNVYPVGGYSVKFYYPTTTTYKAFDGGVHCNMEEGNAGVFVKRYSPLTIVAIIKNFGNQNIQAINVSTSVSHPTALGTSGTGQVASLFPGTDTSLSPGAPLIPTDAGIYTMISQVSGIVGDLVASNNILQSKIIAVDTVGTQIPLVYHDDTPEPGGISWSGGSGGIGYYIQPPFYPCQINGYRITIAADPTASGCYLKIYDDDGPNGGPGTLLDSVYASPTSYTVGVNTVIPTAGTQVTVNSGGFYVLWVMPAGSNVILAWDRTPPISNRSYEYLSGLWAPCRFRFTEDYFLGVSVAWANFEDAQALRIVSPAANALLLTPTPVQFRALNAGSSVNGQPIELGYKFSIEAPVYHTIPAGSLLPGDSITHQFNVLLSSGALRSGTLCSWVRMNGDMNNTNDTTCINVTYQPGVGFQELVRDNTRWTLYPNPASDEIRILGLNEQVLSPNWVLTDAVGRVLTVPTVQESPSEIRVDLRGLPAGVYSVRSTGNLGQALPLLIRR